MIRFRVWRSITGAAAVALLLAPGAFAQPSSAQGAVSSALGAAAKAKVASPPAAASVKPGGGGLQPSDPAADKAEADEAAAMASASNALQTLMAVGPQQMPNSAVPAGKAAEVSGRLILADGTAIPVKIVTHDGHVNFNNDPAFHVGVSVSIGEDGLTIHSVVNADGKAMAAPIMTLAPGASSTVLLADGSQLVLSAVVRDATPSELTSWGTIGALLGAR